MTWLDDFYTTGQAITSGYVGSAASYAPPQPLSGGYDPWRTTSGGSTFGTALAPRLTAPKAPTAKPGFPVKVELPNPYRKPDGFFDKDKGAAPLTDTTGNPFASLGAAIGSHLSQLDLGNFLPFYMERTNVAASTLSKTLAEAAGSGNVLAGLAKGSADALLLATDPFLGAVKVASDAVAPVVDAAVNLYRDARNSSNAKVFRALVSGQELSLIDSLTLSGDLFRDFDFIPGRTEQSARDQYEALNEYRRLMSGTSPASDKIEELRLFLDQIDLPESIKEAISKNPSLDDDQIAKLFDEAPEGRQWSYEPGVGGDVSRFGYTLGGYALAFLATRRVALGTNRAIIGTPARASLKTGEIISEATVGLGARSPALLAARNAAVRGITIGQQLQKAAIVSGLGYSALQIGGETIARTFGAQAAIDWFEKVSSTANISDNTNVQIVTGFTVNPFAVASPIKNGIMRLYHGAPIKLAPGVGDQFATLYTADDKIMDIMRQIYDQPDIASTRVFVGRHYAEAGSAADEVVSQAAQVVVNRLRNEERALLTAMSHSDRARAVLEAHGQEIMDVINNEPSLIRDMWQNNHWNYRNMPLAYNPEVAALIARDYRMAMRRSVEFRNQVDSVVTFQEMLPERGQVLAREWLDGAVDATGNVKIEGVNGLQDLVRQFPVFRKLWGPYVPKGARTGVIPRSAVESMIDEASAEYARIAKTNPQRAATGVDPLLRPDATPGELARALGTDADTAGAWLSADEAVLKAGGTDRLRAFLRAKTELGETAIDGMTPAQVYNAADEYISRVTEPWIRRWTEVENAQRAVRSLTEELATLRGRPNPDTAVIRAL
ncbi:MAG TPA: hypothetical protein VM285_11140, partial [Polyangia bacterium]|nr:hypothetical protein [Polyangia bacterium]